ncbi:transmembrane 9 superfamily member 8-like [Cucumis melo var. makuwa]|uniref:Transmembrane 9 superfamily member n=2 Tax=Cucumis melo TaxID=3656 RepID=A0A1S3BU94_CUCME|nr:transmembrane 9 superfamily member 8-like [Cucumis melo]XP_050943769.1 transmembrane 9 superfamily member 8-like [Cucumis melo]XP_050943770.1 transmembrane 9 superfamily member 8-like [Cucumis melo]XP_050943771.1 transmembrane 9 superfamily member 8-like [Cucumis melo]XP_050943772.1 transmembrane 9 superfamily member 8-like [Cucumis melo]XP_050943773.1 transmembrane 9 superfamily member 8-like [Cucumis melo]XP_050943774.1 transmembrane 9 superfamily member 8-like [Cucumis melo]XP_05094377
MASRISLPVQTLTIALSFLLLFHSVHCFNLFGIRPVDFKKGDDLKVKVKGLTSTKTQLPVSYYSLPFCRPEKIEDDAENLGEILLGDRSENSPYVAKMLEHQLCNIVCRIELDGKGAEELKEKIEDEYMVHMILDNLPLVHPIRIFEHDSPLAFQLGFHMGLKGYYPEEQAKYFIYNHLLFTIKYYHDIQSNSTRIVGFEVKPFSIKHEYNGKWKERNTRLSTCDPIRKIVVMNSDGPQMVEEGKEIIFTYDIEFQESDVDWPSRWDAYLATRDDQMHWFSILNGLESILVISGILAVIVWRIYHDIFNFNDLETQDRAQKVTGWKLIHGDVFRPPCNSDLLCVHVGTGVQILGMILGTMLLAILGLLSPCSRGDLITTMLLLWIFMSLCAGYVSARLYKMFNGTDWKKIAFKTAVTFPSVIYVIFTVLNSLLRAQKSSVVVPSWAMFVLLLLWIGISAPLVFVGSYVGFKKETIEKPAKTNSLHRQIPRQSWYMNPISIVLIGGILPFSTVVVELSFSLTATWLNQFYWFFGFHLLVFIILTVTCAEISIMLCYLQLCREDYRWWWRSYITSGSVAVYLFLYSISYFSKSLEITKLISVLLYIGYMLVASYAFFVLTGTIGFFACFWFTRVIYSSVKFD